MLLFFLLWLSHHQDDRSRGIPSYETLHPDIMRYIEMQGLRDQIIEQKLDSLVESEGKGATQEEILAKKLSSLEKEDVNLKNLIREYYDGLLMIEMSNRTIWDKASKDEKALEAYFLKHKNNINGQSHVLRV